MNIYRLTYDFRHDGGDDWTEAVVVAASEEDAVAVCGFGAYPRDKITCELIGTAIDPGRGLVCCGTHGHPPFVAGDEVKLAMGFFPGVGVGATGEVLDVKYEENTKYIEVKWDKNNPEWHGQKDSYYIAMWFDYAEESEDAES